MIHGDLMERGLAKDSEDGVSIPLRRDVRLAYLLLLAQEAREAGARQGFDLQPTTNHPNTEAAMRAFLELSPMPSRGDVVDFDLATASVDLEIVPLDEVLSFRQEHREEHRRYLLNLREFLGEVVIADPGDRKRLVEQRQAELNESAESLTRLAAKAFRTPSTAVGFALGLIGSAWTIATRDPVPGVLATLGASAQLLPNRQSGSAYSYIFAAHRRWPS